MSLSVAGKVAQVCWARLEMLSPSTKPTLTPTTVCGLSLLRVSFLPVWNWTTTPSGAPGRALPPPGFPSSLSLGGVQLFVKSHQRQGILPFDIALAFQDTETQTLL